GCARWRRARTKARPWSRPAPLWMPQIRGVNSLRYLLINDALTAINGFHRTRWDAPARSSAGMPAMPGRFAGRSHGVLDWWSRTAAAPEPRGAYRLLSPG